MRARLLDMGMVNPLRSQSIYHAITSCMNPDSDPAITIMRPSSKYVSIGFFQEADKEVDLDYCRQKNLPVIRRQVGGGAVLLDQNQLFFHVILPSARAKEFGLPRTLQERFAYLARPPILAYHKLGINASFRPVNDIHVNGKKIGGTGVGEIGDGLVFAGSMMLDFDTTTMARVLKVPDEKMRDKIAQSLNAYMTTIKKELAEPPQLTVVAEALLSSFEEFYNLTLIPSMPAPEEMDAIYEWDKKLSGEDWLHQVKLQEKNYREVKISANVHLYQAAHKAPGGLMRVTVRTVDNHIDELLLSGDFPVSPQDSLKELSLRFNGAKLDAKELEKRLQDAFREQSFEFAGVDENDFYTLFQQILQ